MKMKTQYTNVYRSRPKYKKGELVTKKKTKKKKSQTTYLYTSRKQNKEQTKHKISKREEIINIREEIYQLQYRRIKGIKPKINKVNKPLARSTENRQDSNKLRK